MASAELIQAIAVTSELCGRVFSEGAAKVFVDDLAAYPEAQVMASLRRCRKEVKGVLTLQDVISRLEDGRPGPEEAWAMLPMNEAQTTVWTAEMAQAFGVAVGMIDAGEVVAARMAFKETYNRLVNQARDHRQPVEWFATLGHDPRGRESVLLQAVNQGKLSLEYARGMCPQLPEPTALALIENATKHLSAKKEATHHHRMS
jgi:hypothetical protein